VDLRGVMAFCLDGPERPSAGPAARGARTAGEARATRTSLGHGGGRPYPDGSFALFFAVDAEQPGAFPRRAVADAELLRASLEARGFETVAMLYGRDCDRAHVRRALSAAARRMRGRPRARVLVYVGGAGAMSGSGPDEPGSEPLLLASGAVTRAGRCLRGRAGVREDAAFPLRELVDRFARRIAPDQQLMLFNCPCADALVRLGHNGARPGLSPADPTRKEAVGAPCIGAVFATLDGAAPVEAAEEGHGLFALAVASWLDDDDGTHHRHMRPAGDLVAACRAEVSHEAERRGARQEVAYHALLEQHRGRDCVGHFFFAR
jgi:hypothetical protein